MFYPSIIDLKAFDCSSLLNLLIRTAALQDIICNLYRCVPRPPACLLLLYIPRRPLGRVELASALMAHGAPPFHDLVAHIRLIVFPIIWVLFKIILFFLLFLVLLMEEHAASHSPRALLRVALVEDMLHLFLDKLVLLVLVRGRGLPLQLKWRNRNSGIVAISDVVISLLGVRGF